MHFIPDGFHSTTGHIHCHHTITGVEVLKEGLYSLFMHQIAPLERGGRRRKKKEGEREGKREEGGREGGREGRREKRERKKEKKKQSVLNLQAECSLVHAVELDGSNGR